MPRFFVEDVVGDVVVLEGEDARHIAKSLRMQVGEELILCDGRGFDYRCALTSVIPGAVEAQILEKQPNQSEPTVQVRLYQALPKGDKLDFIVQKAVELGAVEIVPVLTEHCVSRPDGKAMNKKRERLQRISLEAAKQSGRGIIPQILPLVSFREAIEGMKASPCAILLYERATAPLSVLLEGKPCTISLLVGSEGGFSPEEAEYAWQAGIALTSLGPRILRCETAPLCALSAILYASGEF